jgi:hypothetical protein
VNRTRAQRAAIVAPLVELRKQQGGRLLGWQVASVAHQYKRDPRSIRRDLVELDLPGSSRRKWRAPREFLVRAAMYDGNILRAFEEMRKEQDDGVADYGLKGYWSAYRAVHADPGLQVALKKGIEKFQAFLMVGEFVSTYRNELCYVDAYKIPVLCVDQYGKLIEHLWLLSVFEGYARLVPAHAICVGEVTGQLTADTLLAAAMGRWLSVEELAQHGIESAVPLLLGGPGESTIFDNAQANKSDVTKDTCKFIGTSPIFGRPHIAVDKAPQERWHWTLELDLQALPGYTNGAERHPQLAWERMAPLTPHLVHPRGVKLPGPEFRTVTHRDFVPGRTVELRTLHGVPGRTFFGVDGRFRAEVKPHPRLSEDEVKDRGVQNSIRGRTARSVLKEAGERLIAEGLPDEIAALSRPEPAFAAAPSPRRRIARANSANPNRRAAVKATWTNPEEGVA